MSFHRWLEIIKDVEPGKTLPAGMSRRAVIVGDKMVAIHEAFPNLKCQSHSHPSSQLSYMLQGKLRMTIGGEERVIAPGAFAYVGPNVEHSIESLDEYVLVLDIFSPARADIAERLQELEALNADA